MFQNARSKLERSHGLVSANGRERIQERFERVPGREVLEENAHRNARPNEDRGSGKNLGVTVDDGASVHLSTSSAPTIAKRLANPDVTIRRNGEMATARISQRIFSVANGSCITCRTP